MRSHCTALCSSEPLILLSSKSSSHQNSGQMIAFTIRVEGRNEKGLTALQLASGAGNGPVLLVKYGGGRERP